MTPPALALSEAAAALCLLLIFLVPLTLAGLSLIHNGLGRSRSAAHAMLASLCVVSVGAIVYLVCGFSWEGFAGQPAHIFTVAGKNWNWIAAEPFFLRGVELDGGPASLAALLQLFCVGLAAVIPLSAAADRWRLGAACASSALLAGLTYPLFAHWSWGGGWLAQLGVNFGLGHGFVDSGGAGSIQVVGGLTALSLVWILGPRRGKYSSDGMPAAIPGHNIVFVLFGCLLTWVGWLGLNSAGAILFSHAEPGRVALIAINTTVSATAAFLVAVITTRLRFGRVDASLGANGWVGGLVASSAACAFLKPAAALMTGLIAGALVTFAIDCFEFWLAVDDPGGAISVHAVAGIWGLLAGGVLATLPGGNAGAGQCLAQVVGVATLIGFVLPMTYLLNWLLNRFYPQRVHVDGERQGMDLHELGGMAYPEFVVHSEEFTPK
ncbi:MAG TPA: hypothetical protein VE083_12065 [Terriglobales bacterium]|nr:hypothetical protein [Terriglobales bacterium]